MDPRSLLLPYPNPKAILYILSVLQPYGRHRACTFHSLSQTLNLGHSIIICKLTQSISIIFRQLFVLIQNKQAKCWLYCIRCGQNLHLVPLILTSVHFMRAKSAARTVAEARSFNAGKMPLSYLLRDPGRTYIMIPITKASPKGLAMLSAHVKTYPECVMNVPAISSHRFHTAINAIT